MQSFTARMLLLIAASAFGLVRRCWSSPQHCYLHCLHALSESKIGVKKSWFISSSLISGSQPRVLCIVWRRVCAHHSVIWMCSYCSRWYLWWDKWSSQASQTTSLDAPSRWHSMHLCKRKTTNSCSTDSYFTSAGIVCLCLSVWLFHWSTACRFQPYDCVIIHFMLPSEKNSLHHQN